MLKPIRSEVLLRPLETEYKQGSIILTEGKEAPLRHEVLAVADKVTTVKPGDIVAHRNWVGEKYKHEGEDCLLVDVKEILGFWDA